MFGESGNEVSSPSGLVKIYGWDYVMTTHVPLSRDLRRPTYITLVEKLHSAVDYFSNYFFPRPLEKSCPVVLNSCFQD